ncbi:MAG: AAA family ATPase [Thermodesulfobacteriota bacterium]|nr:AAA family ATPase [Thermodesulfobacteriota bacterium]
MLDNFEKKVLRNYLRNLLQTDQMTQKMFSAVCDWLDDHLENIIVGKINEKTWKIIDEYNSAIKERSGVKAQQKKFLAEMWHLLSITENSDDDMPISPLEQSLTILTDEIKLDENDRIIISLLARYKIHDDLENLFDNLGVSGGTPLQTISLLTGLTKQCVTKHLSINSQLVSSGLIQLKSTRYRGTDLTDRVDLPDSIAEALIKTCDNPDDIRTHILGNPVQAELDWEDFSHLDEIRTQLLGFLKKSLLQNLTGINILLWGPPGTGKTEFCKTLAQQIDCNLYTVGETDDEGDEPTRRERLDAMRLTQSLLQYQNNNLLMFDEMDDLFEQSGFAALFGGKLQFSSKVYTNRLFEKNPVPTLWIINDVASLDETIIRRMSLVLEIKSPPKSARQGVWNRIIAKHELDLPDQAVAELMNLEASPAVLDNAVRFARINGHGTDDILFATRGIIKAIKGSIKPVNNKPSTAYCSGLVNADMNLNDLGARLKQSGQRQFSLCLYGSPGTGKTEYVRQLADQLGMEVLVKRASDLLGSYVGETERQIAAAFQEAQDNESFLIFDEADSLLGDRRHAHQSWEISQVNEMLTWMESHPLPFACTTNLIDRLDQASLRRFTFKVGFSPLTQTQNGFAFSEFFGINAPEAIRNLSNLTPGDFTVVRKKAEIMDVLGQPEELIKMLETESSVKKSAANPIGFLVH